MNYLPTLHALLLNDALRMEALIVLRHLHLPDGWIGAGFVRDAVWSYRHKHPRSPVPADVDVVWFDDSQCSEAQDRELEATLKRLSPVFNWSVKNQARMHRRNGDIPYRSTEDALHFWPETATAVAVRLTEDLFELRLRPTPRFEHEKRAIFWQRVAEKRWLTRYPLLRIVEDHPCHQTE